MALSLSAARSALLLGAALTFEPHLASAQEPSADAVAPDATSYPAAFFAAFNPVTAEDMVRRVPAFTLDNGLDRRGFAASAGNVLINGERPSSKTPISEQLSRISARDVERINLVTGVGGGGDLRGQTLVVDVRLRARQAGATNAFVMQAGVLEPGWNGNPVANVTSAFRVGPTNINLALQAQPSRRGRIEYEKELRAPTGALIEQGRESLQGEYWEYKLSGRAGWQPTPDDAVNVSLQLTPSRDGRRTFSEVVGPTGGPVRTEDSSVSGDLALAVEAGADWERRVSARTSFKFVGLATRRESGSEERYTSTPATGAARSTFIRRESESGEYIARGVLTYRMTPEHTLDFGGEGAFNFLDSELDIEVDVGSGRQPVPLPVANTRVEESRGELFISDAWRPSSTFTLESSLTVEASRISQSGDASQERALIFVKPRVVVTWSRSARDQFRLRLERDVTQLDFTEFASAVSLFDGTVDLGNPNLEPERAWRAQLDWEHRFGPRATMTLGGYFEHVDAVQDQIPIAGQFDAPGNLGDGRRAGVKLDVLAPLDGVGLRGGDLRLRGTVQETRVDDPVTGKSRRFSEEADWTYSVELRQPLPQQKLAWGVLWERAADTQLFRLKELRTTGWDRGSLDAYLETTAIQGVVIRFTVADILLPREVRERRFFAPDRTASSNLASVETRRAVGGYGTRSYTLRVAGRF